MTLSSSSILRYRSSPRVTKYAPVFLSNLCCKSAKLLARLAMWTTSSPGKKVSINTEGVSSVGLGKEMSPHFQNRLLKPRNSFAS